MIDVSQVTACLVTRGDVDMAEIIDSLPFERVVIYDNSRERDISVYGRYEAVVRSKGEICFTQDDDCLLEPEAFEMLLDAYQPGHIVTNMPERFRPHYPDSALVGFGALFERHLPIMAFGKFFAHGADGLMPSELMWRAITEQPEPFLRECDGVFTALTPRILIDVPYTDLPWADAPNRLWKQREHFGERRRMLNLARKVRDA